MSNNLSDNIKIARKKKNLTQKALGELIGKSYEAIRKYENGERQPPLSVIEKLREVLDVPMRDLVGADYSPSIFSKFPKIPNKAIKMINPLESLIEACGYKIHNLACNGSSISPEHAEEEVERFWSDKSNILMELVSSENEIIDISINNYKNLCNNLENFIEFELFKLKNKSDKKNDN